MTLAADLSRASAANAVGLALGAFGQIASILVMIRAWGASGYGTWLMLTTIPAYLALSDFGFLAASTSDMTARSARGEKDGVNRLFNTLAALVAVVALAIYLLGAAVIWTCLLDGNWMADHRLVLHLLLLYSGLALISRVSLAALRANGAYAAGTLTYDTLTFAEVMVTLLVVWTKGTFADACFAMIVCRVVNIVLVHVLLKHRVPWLALRPASMSPAELRRLVRPALGGMVISAALAIMLQTSVLITGMVLSPAAAAVFATVRTVSRIPIQCVSIVSRATMPSFASATALSLHGRRQNLLHLNCLLIASILLPSAAILAIVGSAMISWWTGGEIEPSGSLMAAMALGMVAHGGWTVAANLLMATNSHSGFAGILLALAPLSTLLVYLGAVAEGLTGAGVALALGEAACFAAALYAFRGGLTDKMRSTAIVPMPGR
jgi:O-antigen/teichoic acid export membrane protein